MNILIAGGWKRADFLIKSLLAKDHKLTVIHDNMIFSKKLSRKYDIPIINGDPSKPYILEEANVDNIDMVIALTDRDEKNLVICQLCKKLYDVGRTLSIVSNPKNVEVFKELGVVIAISATHVITNVIEQTVMIDGISQIAPIEEGRVVIIEVSVEGNSPLVNKSLIDINMSEGGTISCIIRGTKTIIPKGKTLILENDKLIILALEEFREEIMKGII